LYDDDRFAAQLNQEEEKVLVHPTRVKQSFLGIDKKTDKAKPAEKAQEPVDDTIPDFGFVSKTENQSKEALKADSKVVINKKSNSKPPKKLKIKKTAPKNDENEDPFLGLTDNSAIKSSNKKN
jgi:hypothetical protein